MIRLVLLCMTSWSEERETLPCLPAGECVTNDSSKHIKFTYVKRIVLWEVV